MHRLSIAQGTVTVSESADGGSANPWTRPEGRAGRVGFSQPDFSVTAFLKKSVLVRVPEHGDIVCESQTSRVGTGGQSRVTNGES